MRRELLVSLLLSAVVAAVYWPVHSYPFVLLDDHSYVVDNPYVRPGLTGEGVAHAFALTGITVGNWHPLTMLSHMLDCQLFGVECGAGWHHVVNVALHAANTVLLFLALRWMTGAFWPSALAAALFGLHPQHVESVAWISERKDVLSTLFFLLMLLAYCHYVRRPTVLRFAAVFLCLALGLMSKPMLVTAPFVLLLLDYWPLDRGRLPRWRLVAEKIPLLALAAVSAVLTFVVQQRSGAMGMLGQPVPLETRLGNAVCVYGEYLEKSFWPSPLSAVYPYFHRKGIDILIIGVALVAISVAVVRLARIRPFLLVGWCWYLGTLVPVIGLVQVGVQSMADRYTYIPLIGIFIIAAWGAAEFTEGWPARNKALAAAVLLAACGWFSWWQLTTWSSSEALFLNAVKAVRYNVVALDWLGKAYWEEGKLEQAQEQFEAILKIEKAMLEEAMHKKDQNFHGFEPAHRTLGLLLAVRHQRQEAFQDALKEFDRAIEIRPQQPEPYRHKAWLLATSLDNSIRDGRKAVECAREALEKSARKQPEYWDTLAAALAEAGKFEEAVEAAEKALEQAQAMRADDLIPGIRERLELFKLGRPYHAEAQYPQRL